MARNAPQPDPEDLHQDLLATMAASRELGPEMDKALVDSYMERHPELKGQQKQALTQPETHTRPDIVGLTGMSVGMIGYIVLLIVSHGSLWWMFWPMMAWGGWRWGSNGHHDERHAARQQMREARFQARMEARMNRYGVPYVRVNPPVESAPQQPATLPPAPAAPPVPPVASPPLASPPVAPAPPTPAPLAAETPAPGPSSLPPINPAG